MQIFTDRRSLEQWVAQQKEGGKTIGFVPTMGALHNGHIALIKKSKEQNDLTVCSIFVNPTQFDNPEDLAKYPRNTEADTQKLAKAGCDAIFIPSVEDIYPDKAVVEKFSFGGIEKQMEGKYRKGHFDGVATVVSRFFDIVKPDKAYFGQKDFQQLRIIQELVNQKYPGLKIVPVAIQREKSGLAMSSRNMRLSEEEKTEATHIFKLLNLVKDWKNDLSVTEVIHNAEEYFRNTDLELEYFMLCDEKTLKPVSTWDEAKDIRAFVAAYSGKIRLIDNLKIT